MEDWMVNHSAPQLQFGRKRILQPKIWIRVDAQGLDYEATYFKTLVKDPRLLTYFLLRWSNSLGTSEKFLFLDVNTIKTVFEHDLHSDWVHWLTLKAQITSHKNKLLGLICGIRVEFTKLIRKLNKEKVFLLGRSMEDPLVSVRVKIVSGTGLHFLALDPDTWGIVQRLALSSVSDKVIVKQVICLQWGISSYLRRRLSFLWKSEVI